MELMKTTIAQLIDFDGQEVTLNGWVYNLRSIGKIWFLILRDGTGLVQCVVVKAEIDEAIFNLENELFFSSLLISIIELNVICSGLNNVYQCTFSLTSEKG